MSLLRRRQHNPEPFRWNALATYNGERSRGIVHTEEWKARMAEEKRQFDIWAAWTSPIGSPDLPPPAPPLPPVRIAPKTHP